MRVTNRGQTIKKVTDLRPRIKKEKILTEKICSSKEIKQGSGRWQLGNSEDLLMLTLPYLSDSCLESKHALYAIMDFRSHVSSSFFFNICHMY